MECLKFFNKKTLVNGRTTIYRIDKIGGKLTRTVYAGLIVCFVPSVLCQGWSRRLTYDEIYNDTNYVQLQQRPRPYDITEYSYEVTHVTPDKNVNSHRNTEINTEVTTSAVFNRYSLEEIVGNEIDSDINDYERVKEPLLVGFSHDPYRYSVPEEDYLKGVRDMSPKSIMSKGENRGKRGVLHLYNMMYCATGCEPLSYKGYGCYCGFLGSGRPTDGIDRCCKIHDECYENIYCPFYTVYFQPYYWKCYKGQPLCALENYHTQHQFINGCAARLCECDRRFAMCVKRYKCPRRRALCRSSPLRLLQNLFMLP